MKRVTDDERRRRLARRHRLLPEQRRDSVAEIADSVVALHSSDPVTVFLSVAARSDSLTVEDVERALYEEQSVVRRHAMRRTLWVMTPAIAEVAHAACTRKIAASERARSAKLVGDAAWFDAAVEQVIACVRASAEPISTRRIGEMHPELRREIVFGAGTRNEATASAHTRAVLVAAFDGAIVRARPAGSWIGSQYAWTDASRWTGIDTQSTDEHDGLTQLVGRWLERFGPGTLDDLVWWTGTTKTAIRRAVERLDASEVGLGGNAGFCLAADLDETPDVGAWTALLPGLDPAAMGWKDRAWYLDDETGRRVTDRNGNIGPTVWADGRIVGGWAQRPDGEIAMELTHTVSKEHQDLLDAEVERVGRFVGDARFRVRFPSPNQKDLLT